MKKVPRKNKMVPKMVARGENNQREFYLLYTFYGRGFESMMPKEGVTHCIKLQATNAEDARKEALRLYEKEYERYENDMFTITWGRLLS